MHPPSFGVELFQYLDGVRKVGLTGDAFHFVMYMKTPNNFSYPKS